MDCEIELSIAYLGEAFCVTHSCHPSQCPPPGEGVDTTLHQEEGS